MSSTLIKSLGALSFALLSVLASSADSNAAVRLCQNKPFKPCVCWQDVPKAVQYNPSQKECGGRAAVVLSGFYFNSFSVVVRDKQNRDRTDPNCASNSCSLFKVQRTIYKGGKRINCLGASGKSKAFRNVVRITVKVSDAIREDGSKDIRRFCLRSPKLPLNIAD